MRRETMGSTLLAGADIGLRGLELISERVGRRRDDWNRNLRLDSVPTFRLPGTRGHRTTSRMGIVQRDAPSVRGATVVSHGDLHLVIARCSTGADDRGPRVLEAGLL